MNLTYISNRFDRFKTNGTEEDDLAENGDEKTIKKEVDDIEMNETAVEA